MSRRPSRPKCVLAIAALLLLLATGTVQAQELSVAEPAPEPAPTMSFVTASLPAPVFLDPGSLFFATQQLPPVPGQTRPLPAPEPRPIGQPRPKPPSQGGSAALGSLYVSFAVLQGLDLHSTFKALDAGGRETNPFMAGIASNRGAMIGMKAATTGAAILLADRVARNNKTASFILMAAMNTAFAAVVAHNYRVAKTMGGGR
jgi:hypothetical protein